MKGNGMKISNMAKGKRSGRMELSLRAPTGMERRKASGNSAGQMVPSMKGTSSITASMARDSTDGKMAEHTMENGNKT